jgi:Fe2+ or Zn2+ uptake regulation protein
MAICLSYKLGSQNLFGGPASRGCNVQQPDLPLMLVKAAQVICHCKKDSFRLNAPKINWLTRNGCYFAGIIQQSSVTKDTHNIDCINLFIVYNIVMMTSNEALLKEHHLSLTPVRLAVLDALEKHPHSDVATLFDVVIGTIKTTSKQAIYNNLNTLVAHGIVREIKPKGQPSLYETRVGDNHHHIVCKSCHKVMDAECLDFAPSLLPAQNHGFVVDEAEVTFWGYCPSCQKPTHKKRV